jgi:hypothetical protein
MIRSRTQRLLVATCLLFWPILAADAAFAAPAGSNAGEINVLRQERGYTWTLRAPDRPGVVQVSLSVRDAAGNPVRQKTLTGEVWMPTMPMPGYPLPLEFSEEEDGSYFALVQYGHGGYWQIRAEFRDDKGEWVRQVFDFDLKD